MSRWARLDDRLSPAKTGTIPSLMHCFPSVDSNYLAGDRTCAQVNVCNDSDSRKGI